MEETRKRARGTAFEVLYICGNNFEDEASAMLRDGICRAPEFKLRVRLHPRNNRSRNAQAVQLGGAGAVFRSSHRRRLPTTLAAADAAIMVRSTVALDAMFAGVPVIWLSPSKHRAELESHPMRKQGLALLDAATRRGVAREL